MKVINLTQGRLAMVDDEDFDLVSQWMWCVNSKGYVVNRRKGLLHRFIMDYPVGLEVDHKNGDKFDCQKSNLRLATRSENMRNSHKKAVTSSRFKGVSFKRKTKEENAGWAARITVHRKLHYLGKFNSEEEAAIAYNAAAIELHGEFANLNDL